MVGSEAGQALMGKETAGLRKTEFVKVRGAPDRIEQDEKVTVSGRQNLGCKGDSGHVDGQWQHNHPVL